MKNAILVFSLTAIAALAFTKLYRKTGSSGISLDPKTESQANRGEGLTNEANTGIND